MSSPTKRIDVEKDNTMFGQLSNIEVRSFGNIETNNYAKQAVGLVIIDNKSFEKRDRRHSEVGEAINI